MTPEDVEAYAFARGSELWLLNAHIPEYAQGNIHNHAPLRERKLLLHRRELDAWRAAVKEKGVTIVPLAIYFRSRRVKVLLALCKGKKLYDKREVQREREDRREIERAMRRR